MGQSVSIFETTQWEVTVVSTQRIPMRFRLPKIHGTTFRQKAKFFFFTGQKTQEEIPVMISWSPSNQFGDDQRGCWVKLFHLKPPKSLKHHSYQICRAEIFHLLHDDELRKTLRATNICQVGEVRKIIDSTMPRTVRDMDSFPGGYFKHAGLKLIKTQPTFIKKMGGPSKWTFRDGWMDSCDEISIPNRSLPRVGCVFGGQKWQTYHGNKGTFGWTPFVHL